MNTVAVSKKKARVKKIAVIDAWCTGCGGAPVCMVFCRKNALVPVRDRENPPFTVMTVNRERCIGCGACISKGEQDTRISGCPWNAIHIETLDPVVGNAGPVEA